jgi:hypothetical protein
MEQDCFFGIDRSLAVSLERVEDDRKRALDFRPLRKGPEMAVICSISVKGGCNGVLLAFNAALGRKRLWTLRC